MCTFTGVLLVASCVATIFCAAISEPAKNSKFKNPTLITEYENSKFENPTVDREDGRKLAENQDEEISNSKFKHPTIITADRNSKFENPILFQVRARNLEEEEQFTNSKFKNPLLITPDRNSKFENPALIEKSGRKMKIGFFASRVSNRKQENEIAAQDPVYEDDDFKNSKFLNPTLYDDETSSNSKFEDTNAIDDKVNYDVTLNNVSLSKGILFPLSRIDDVRDNKQTLERGIFRERGIYKILKTHLLQNRNNTVNIVLNNNKVLLRPFLTGYLEYLNRHGGLSSNDNTFVYRITRHEGDSEVKT